MTQDPAAIAALAKLPASKPSLRKALTFLESHAGRLEAFEDIEDFAVAASEDPDDELHAIGVNLMTVRTEVARELWNGDVFVSLFTIDQVVYFALRNHADNVLAEVAATLRRRGLGKAGAIVFPVHSFGVLAAGLAGPLSGASIDFVSPYGDYALTPQTNSLEKSLQFIDRSLPQLGVDKPPSHFLLTHWYNSRGLRWLIRNPLLLVRFTSLQGRYYEHQFAVTSRVRVATAQLAMMASLQRKPEQRSRLFSTSTMNNYQTLDIHHYVLLFDEPHAEELEGDCVPIHASRDECVELCDLSFEVAPLARSLSPAVTAAIRDAVEGAYAGYIRYSVTAARKSPRSRLYWKLFNSLLYFRRSFDQADDNWRGVVALACAFEMLLTDHYAGGGIGVRMRDRARVLMKGQRGVRALSDAVEALYEERSAVVHGGQIARSIELRLGQEAFTRCFVSLSRRLGALNPRSNSPIADLTGI